MDDVYIVEDEDNDDRESTRRIKRDRANTNHKKDGA